MKLTIFNYVCFRIRLQARAKTAVSNINQALTNLKNFLEQKYMPAGRTAWGVSGWPEGRELYQECLKYHTSTDMSPEEVYDLGMQEVSRIRRNMKIVSNFVLNSIFDFKMPLYACGTILGSDV